MTSLHKNQVKFNSNITISHTGGQLSSDSGLVLVKELMNIFGFSELAKQHIHIERMYYSVPYEYIQTDVDVRLSKDLIEVYFKDARIASHKRLYGEIGQFSTLSEHMPDNHRFYLEHTPANSREWALSIGTNMERFMAFLLKNGSEKKL